MSEANDDKKKLSESFCALPFVQLQMQPTGNVSPCCWNQGVVLGNVKDEDIFSIWNGEKMRELRREFLSGEVKSCAQQVRHIGCQNYFRHLEPIIELTEFQKKGPRKLDLRLNGKCNLQCVMCEVWQQPNGLYDECGFWERGPTEIFPHLLEVDVLGGEPFVQKDTFRLIDEVTKLNPDCGWAFVTNGQWKFAGPIRERLDRIRIRWMQISLDAIRPETYTSIRNGGKIDRVLETFRTLLDYRRERAAQGREFRLIVSMCVQPENFDEIEEFMKFVLAAGAEPVLQFLYEPAALSLLSLPEEKREEMIQRLESFPKILRNFVGPILTPLLDARPARGLPTQLAPPQPEHQPALGSTP